jgi:phosphate transport system substrate-binding protein
VLLGLLLPLGIGLVEAAAKPQHQSLQIRGAGATFPAPLLQQWIPKYSVEAGPDLELSYVPVGSSEGLRRLLAREVDFAAVELSPVLDDSEVAPTIKHIEVALSGVAIAYNVPGLNAPLRLTAETLADIFSGRIERWDDPRLKALNPALPSAPIILGFRGDGSGTTDLFTRYLSVVDARWKANFGHSGSIKFPVGRPAKGNDGLAALIKLTPYAIGYVQVGYADRIDLPTALLRNRAGQFVRATQETIGAAARAPGDVSLPIDSPGPNAYPIVGYSKILWNAGGAPAKALALARFLWWCIHDGQAEVSAQGYAPLPRQVVESAERTLRGIAPTLGK